MIYFDRSTLQQSSGNKRQLQTAINYPLGKRDNNCLDMSYLFPSPTINNSLPLIAGTL